MGLTVSCTAHAIVLACLAVSLRPRTDEGAAITVAASFTATATSNQPGKGVSVVAQSSQVTGDLVEDKIQSLISRQRGVRPDQTLKRLDQVAQRLDRVSSPESIDELAGVFVNDAGGFELQSVVLPEVDLGECLPTLIFRRDD